MSCLRYLCLPPHSGVQHILCRVSFVLSVILYCSSKLSMTWWPSQPMTSPLTADQAEIQITDRQTLIYIYKNSYFPKTIKDWNNLSDSAVHCKTVTAFKTALTSSRE